MLTSTRHTDLAERLRTLRARSGMSVRTLASAAEFSPSFISQVEKGQASPSIASLERIAAALGVTLARLFADECSSDITVVRAVDRQELSSTWSSARVEALMPARVGRSLEAVMITISPGGRSGNQPTAHQGEEFALCCEGEVTLTLNEDTNVLGKGDSVAFPSTTPHLWENHANVTAHILVVSPRFIH